MNTYAIIAHTQVIENKGEPLHPSWRLKGGTSHWLANVMACNGQQATAIANRLPEIHQLETRDSSMMIEYVTRFEAVTVEEARERAAIDPDSDDISSEEYFRAIRCRGYIETYSAA